MNEAVEGTPLNVHYLFLLFILLIAGCSKGNGGLPSEVTLRCKGNVSTSSVPGGMHLYDNQEIAAHINKGTITFSGNDFLSGKNIKICPEGTMDLSADTLYFDSSGCGAAVDQGKRQYGTYNKILHKLDLTVEGYNFVILNRGTFECAKAEAE